jgi:asparagine synthase (glutamine-hydrolysing)
MAQSGQALSPAAALLGQGVLPLLPTGLVRALAILRHPSQAARNGPKAHSPIHPDFALSQRVDDRAREKGRTFEIRDLADTRALRARVVLATTVLSDGLDCGYQALFGVTTRQPASDVRLFEFCLAVPEEQYQHKGQTRWLFRRAMAERLPPEILANPKRGLQAADWFERLCRAQAQVLEVLTRLEQSDLAKRALDLPRLRRLAEDLPRAASGPTQLLADSRGVLDLGLMTGCFIRWVETGQA